MTETESVFSFSEPDEIIATRAKTHSDTPVMHYCLHMRGNIIPYAYIRPKENRGHALSVLHSVPVQMHGRF